MRSVARYCGTHGFRLVSGFRRLLVVLALAVIGFTFLLHRFGLSSTNDARVSKNEFCSDVLERELRGGLSARLLLRDLLRTQLHLARAHRVMRGSNGASIELNKAYRMLALTTERIAGAMTALAVEKDDEIRTELVEGQAELENPLRVRSVAEPDAARRLIKPDSGRTLVDVCPEIWRGIRHGWPLFYTGHEPSNCTNARPFHSVLAVLLDCSSLTPTRFNRVLHSLESSYGPLTVHLFNTPSSPTDIVTHLNIHYHASPSAALAAVVDNDPPTYVAWLRDLQEMNGLNASLTRLVQASFFYGFDVVGGSHRTRSGDWTRGCTQLGLKNYTLKFVEGYDVSLRDCLVCDFTVGPFVVRTDLLRRTRLAGDADGVAFLDWFLRLRASGALVGVCPDVMFEMEDDREREPRGWKRERWLPLVRTWQLNRVVFPGKSEGDLKFNCDEAHLSCSLRKGIADPICCLEELASAQRFFHHFCSTHNIYSEVCSGSLLGAVKFNAAGGMLPWELDFDAVFDRANFTALKSLAEAFRLNGYTLSDKFGFIDYLIVGTPNGFRGEVYPDSFEGMSQLAMFYDGRQRQMNLTRMDVFGELVHTSYNPALAARNEYGSRSFQHAEHWRSLGEKDGWQAYVPRFEPCPTPGHHACLDEQYLPDGDLQFRDDYLL